MRSSGQSGTRPVHAARPRCHASWTSCPEGILGISCPRMEPNLVGVACSHLLRFRGELQGLGGPRPKLNFFPCRNAAYVALSMGLLVIVSVGVFFYVKAPAHRRNPRSPQKPRGKTDANAPDPFVTAKKGAASARIQPDAENM